MNDIFDAVVTLVKQDASPTNETYCRLAFEPYEAAHDTGVLLCT